MTNPAPRPALRKAPDADLHPARAESSATTAVDLRDLAVDLRSFSDTPASGRPDAPARPTPVPSLGLSRPRLDLAPPVNANAGASPTEPVVEGAKPGVQPPEVTPTRSPAEGDRTVKKSKPAKKTKPKKSKPGKNAKPDKKTKPGKKAKPSKKAKPGKRTKKAKPDKGTKPGKKKKGKGKSAQAASSEQRPATMSSSRIDLRVAVPADLRRTLRTSAKARGTSVGSVVDSVLAGWR